MSNDLRGESLWATKREGWKVTLRCDKPTQEYAMDLLHIFNNVRENSELLCVHNNSSDRIYVICERDSKDATIEYLECFGEVLGAEKILICEVQEPEYDYDRYADCIVYV